MDQKSQDEPSIVTESLGLGLPVGPPMEQRSLETTPTLDSDTVTFASHRDNHETDALCTSLDPADVSMTLVTQCDDARVPLLAQLCARWTQPIAMAVLTHRTVPQMEEELLALGCRREQLQIATLSPHWHAIDAYPVNHLRNLAVRMVQTTHMIYLDIDFVPSSDLESTLLHSQHIRQALAEDHRQALVVPAFEYKPACWNCSTYEELVQALPRNKTELLMLHSRGEVSMFHDYWPVAHDSTDYDAWMLHQEPAGLLDIPCIRANHYEPYLVLRKCRDLPPFQQAFTGYGYNKASFTMQLQAMNYKFRQIGGIFCVHFPHEDSAARQVFDANKDSSQGRRAEIMDLVKKYSQWLKDKYGKKKPLVPYCDKKRKTGTVNPSVSKAEVASAESVASPSGFLERSSQLTRCRAILPEEVSFSIAIQASDDRLWMMQHHCQRWRVNNSMPYISLVVYTNSTLANITSQLQSLGCSTGEGLTLQTFRKLLDDKDYPVNELRNRALAAVTTTHALVLDIDFWPSVDLFTTLSLSSVRRVLAESHENSVVVPALELSPQCRARTTSCHNKHVALMPNTQDKSLFSRWNRSITAFNQIYNFAGHSSTRYDLWMQEESSIDDTLHEIDCVQSDRYEPYLFVRVCQDLPPFQPIFTGYGMNKITWVLQLRRMGYKLFQLPRSFVVHFPHPPSRAKTVWKKVPHILKRAKDKQEKYQLTMRVLNEQRYAAFAKWLEEEIPDRTSVKVCEDNNAEEVMA